MEYKVHCNRNKESQKREPIWLNVRFKTRPFCTAMVMSEPSQEKNVRG